MAKRPKLSIQQIVQLQKETEDLEEDVNILRLENFNDSLKINHLENILANVEAISRHHSANLMESTENLCTILQMSKTATPVLQQRSPKKVTTPDKQSVSASSKAHIIKPHMVNGHVLYRPTINLTRVSDVQVNSQKNGMQDGTLTNEGESFSTSANVEDNEEEIQLSAISEEDEHQASIISHVNNPTSRSPSHSTVLSGTFQEVKIYLNPITPDNLVETKGRKSSNARLSRCSRSSFGRSSGQITTRKKRS